MDNKYIDDFCERYLLKSPDQNDLIPIHKLIEMVRIYIMTKCNNFDYNDDENYIRAFSVRGFVYVNGYFIAKVRPRRRESNLSKNARNLIESQGIILLHEVPCPNNNKYDYDYAFIYRGIFGTPYLYYIEIDGQQHFKNDHWFNKSNGSTKNHDIIKTMGAIKNAYLIRIDYSNIHKVPEIITHAFHKLPWESSLTTSDPNKYSYLANLNNGCTIV